MPTGVRLRPSVLAAREQMAEGRDQLRQQHDRGLDGAKACAKFTSLVDSAILKLYDAALADLPGGAAAELRERVALVAHGGYGRRQQARQRVERSNVRGSVERYGVGDDHDVLRGRAVRPGPVERRIRGLLLEATVNLNRIDYGRLNADAKGQYDSAKGFVRQAEDALRTKNLVFASYLADKAATLAAQLRGR